MARRRQANLARRIVFLLILVSVGLLSYQLLIGSGYFKIARVEVIGDSRNLATDQAKMAALGQNLLFFSEESIKRAISQNLAIGDVKIERDWPVTLKVRITYRQPVLSWQSQRGRYLVDSSGLAYQPAAAEQVPQASDPNSTLALGERIPSEHVRVTLKLMQALRDRFAVLTLSISGGTITITLSSGTVVTLSSDKDLAGKSAALQLILSQAKIEGRAPKTVDLRFDKPVVTY